MAAGAPALARGQAAKPEPTGKAAALPEPAPASHPPLEYPRRYRGRQLAMLAFPLGGIGAGSISLGGRGQLRDWEIFNRPDKGLKPSYALPSLWVQKGASRPVAMVLEAQHLPPYEGRDGLGSDNSPGLRRLRSATFTGEFPIARIDFQDRRVPVGLSLEAFSPFFPLNADDSGLPLAFLRYTVRNPGTERAKVAIAWSIDNPVGLGASTPEQKGAAEKRVNEARSGAGWTGLLMTNPGLPAQDVLSGSFLLAATTADPGEVTTWRGWPRGRWWNSPLLFWDAFSAAGSLADEPRERNQVGTVCLRREIPAGGEATFGFVLAWHFPNRTPERMGWQAAKGEEKTIVGNAYARKFPDPAAVADHAIPRLPELEGKTRAFAAAVRESTLPGGVKDAAMSNLSTLVTTTCFRTADGEFHGWEGVNDKSGCCFGNCTHVWNYETATAHLFPSLSVSLRRAALGHSLDEAGAVHFRQLLPEGTGRSGFAAADGQMGQIIKTYLDWRLSGDDGWLGEVWPRARKALEFAWVAGGWDADKDGVMEGVQHNTYDVEFYGPNPQCGIYYLGALRAAEEMAKAVGDPQAAEYRRLFESGRRWIDANLWNGEYYVQKVRGLPKDRIAPALRSSMGSEDTEDPEYQVGDGCLIDQLLGQYLAEVAGLGPLVDPAHARTALESIYRYNYKKELFDHDSVQRVFALNDEAALVICDYGKGSRPRIPFPYFAEVMTGFEYAAAALMIYAGMVREGVECIENVRRRYDGERRNPWNEAECGHHYARAMAAWSGLLALSGFLYDGPRRHVTVVPRVDAVEFRSFWSVASGWGSFRLRRTATGQRLELAPKEGGLRVARVALALRPGSAKTAVTIGGTGVGHRTEADGTQRVFVLEREVEATADAPLVVTA